jgi:hypothetical protein
MAVLLSLRLDVDDNEEMMGMRDRPKQLYSTSWRAIDVFPLPVAPLIMTPRPLEEDGDDNNDDEMATVESDDELPVLACGSR